MQQTVFGPIEKQSIVNFVKIISKASPSTQKQNWFHLTLIMGWAIHRYSQKDRDSQGHTRPGVIPKEKS